MMAIRVALVVPSLLGGGAEFVTRAWADGLREWGVDIEVVLTQFSPAEPQLPTRVVKLQAVGGSRLRGLVELSRYLKEARVDVALSMMTRTNIDLLICRYLSRTSTKLAISERNILFTEPGQGIFHVLARKMLCRMLYPRADVLVAISHSVGASFQALTSMPLSRLWVIPNPALAKAGLLRGDAAKMRPRTSSITLVVPARLVHKKRPLLALEVADRLHKKGRRIALLYLGEGPLRADVQRLTRSYPIDAPGRVEDWYETLPDDSIVLLPSFVEGFANVLVEAASRGVPSVVGSNAFGSADAVIPGVTGIFARTDSVEEYVDAVEQAARLEGPVPPAWLSQYSLEHSTSVVWKMLQSLSIDQDPGPDGRQSERTIVRLHQD